MYKYNLKVLAEYFKSIQAENRYTQQQMAVTAGVAQSSINKILNEQRVRDETWRRAIRGLGYHPDREFYVQLGIMEPLQKLNPDGTYNREWLAREICQGLVDLNLEHQQAVLDLIDTFKKQNAEREFAVRNA